MRNKRLITLGLTVLAALAVIAAAALAIRSIFFSGPEPLMHAPNVDGIMQPHVRVGQTFDYFLTIINETDHPVTLSTVRFQVPDHVRLTHEVVETRGGNFFAATNWPPGGDRTGWKDMPIKGYRLPPQKPTQYVNLVIGMVADRPGTYVVKNFTLTGNGVRQTFRSYGVFCVQSSMTACNRVFDQVRNTL